MKSKIPELILIAAVVMSVYTDDCVYSPWQRGDCNCNSKSIAITRTVLTGGDNCVKTKLYEPCNCGKYFENIDEKIIDLCQQDKYCPVIRNVSR